MSGYLYILIDKVPIYSIVIDKVIIYYAEYNRRKIDYYIKKYLNINNEYDAIKLVKYLSTISHDTEDIVDTLTNYFKKNMPDDIFLQKISLLLQKNNEYNNIISYSLVTIWISVTQAIIEKDKNPFYIAE